jgi:hypothetical protein
MDVITIPLGQDFIAAILLSRFIKDCDLMNHESKIPRAYSTRIFSLSVIRVYSKSEDLEKIAS